MKFIRDIIYEKRAAKALSPTVWPKAEEREGPAALASDDLFNDTDHDAPTTPDWSTLTESADRRDIEQDGPHLPSDEYVAQDGSFEDLLDLDDPHVEWSGQFASDEEPAQEEGYVPDEDADFGGTASTLGRAMDASAAEASPNPQDAAAFDNGHQSFYERLKRLEAQRRESVVESAPDKQLRQTFAVAGRPAKMTEGAPAQLNRLQIPAAPHAPSDYSAPLSLSRAQMMTPPRQVRSESPQPVAHVPVSSPVPTPVAVPDAEFGRRRSLAVMPFVTAPQTAPTEQPMPITHVQVPPPAAGRGSNRSARVKTRLLGFNPDSIGSPDPFEKPQSKANQAFPVAWLVVIAGPGRGASFSLHEGVSKIGRGDDQAVCLNFGDNSISRENHVAVAYDSEQNAFFVGQSGRTNIVRLNNKPLLSTEELRSGDQIRVGETVLRFASLCGDDFFWDDSSRNDARNA